MQLCDLSQAVPITQVLEPPAPVSSLGIPARESDFEGSGAGCRYPKEGSLFFARITIFQALGDFKMRHISNG